MHKFVYMTALLMQLRQKELFRHTPQLFGQDLQVLSLVLT